MASSTIAFTWTAIAPSSSDGSIIVLPADRAQGVVLYDTFAMERELHQLRVLLEDRAEGVAIPLMGIESILAGR